MVEKSSRKMKIFIILKVFFLLHPFVSLCNKKILRVTFNFLFWLIIYKAGHDLRHLNAKIEFDSNFQLNTNKRKWENRFSFFCSSYESYVICRIVEYIYFFIFLFLKTIKNKEGVDGKPLNYLKTKRYYHTV